MKKTVIVCGLIAGFIVSAIMIISIVTCYNNPDMKGSMLLGYASMILAFSMVFVGIKNTRDNYYGGVISFGKAFKTGLFITLIASTIYVLAWLIEYYAFIPDFMEKYTAHALNAAKESGMTPAEIEKQVKDMETYKELYKNPLFVILLTYAEILPVGLLVVLAASLILKRKEKKEQTA